MHIIFKETDYIDFHTHRLRQKERNDIQEIVSFHLGKELNEHHIYTIGKHPWWTSEVLSLLEKEQFKQHFLKDNCLAMGEMGLDKLKGVEMAQQINILKSQLNLASELNLPVILHCVRAYHHIQQIKKEYPRIKKWCIHGYPRHFELANQLINQGFYLSIMPVRTITETYRNLILNLPLNRFFLETDSMPDANIVLIYEQVADILLMSTEELKKQMAQNVNDFFYGELA